MRKIRLLFILSLSLFGIGCLDAAEAIPQQVASAEPALHLEDYRGKVVYLDFWASWCVPCRKSFPWMNDLQARYRNSHFAIVAVNLDKDPALAQQFLAQYPAQFEIKYDPQGQLAKQYQIPGMPSSLLIDANGKIIETHSGFFQKKIAEYEQAIDAAVGALQQNSLTNQTNSVETQL